VTGPSRVSDPRPPHPVRRDVSAERRRQIAGRCGRRIRLLRAHGLVRKVPRSHCYILTPKGHQLAAALFAARHATTKQILRNAA
jgi:hypothetical protein